MEGVIIRPEKRRRRPKVSCTLCRTRKIRCNRERPCSNCQRSRTRVCVYEGLSPSSSHPGQYPTPGSQEPTRSNGAFTPHSHAPHSRASSPSIISKSNDRFTQDNETARLKLRIRQLEDQLANATPEPVHVHDPAPDSNNETTISRLNETIQLHYKRASCEQPESIVNSVSHKTRLFGQSHWVVSVAYLANDFFSAIEPYLPDQASEGIEQCKFLARRIKARRAPPWPSPLTSKLPSRTICDALVDHYLRTSESLYRVLHVPTFRRKYRELWVPGAEQDINFLIQLKLVLAIGSITYDDQFSLRTSAIRWVYEAQIWISGPKYKARLNIQSMQTNLLLLFAQEGVGVGGDLPWVSAGALLRKAIHLGLHRDPSHLSRGALFDAEIRRRLWNTILEANLQSSLAFGGVPLISLSDFDTAPPGNFDDDQLEVQDPMPKLTEEITQSSFAIALRSTFPQRLAVVKFLNDIASPGTYKETLRLDAELRTAYKELSRTLRACRKPSACLSTFHFETKVVDFLMQRYLSALHIPCFGLALKQTAYAYSQKAVIESSLKLWRAACPPSTTQPNSDMAPSDDDNFPRLVACSSGFYPSAIIHAAFIIAVELRSELQEEYSLCPTPVRPDLLSVLEDAKAWYLKTIEAGETSVKGYLLLSLVSAQVQGTMHGFGKEETADLLMKTVENVGKRCLPILEQMATAQDQATDAGAEGQHATLDDNSEDWGFMTSDALLSLDNAGPLSWVFNDDLNLGDSLF